ncbi:MAG TPA: universal stress protein [Acidimicrobiales bacterium]|nr:universal stress protein [Acidimicrobiales bacterium]
MVFETVVVGVDGSEGSRRAVSWAANQLPSRSGRLIAVHAYHPPPGSEMFGIDPGHKAKAVTEMTEQLESDWTEPAREVGVEPETRLLEGAAGRVLERVATEVGADTVVLGHDEGRFTRYLLGSTAAKLIYRGTHPVVVVGAGHRTGPLSGPIVVGCAEPEQASVLLNWAIDIAEERGLEVVALRASNPDPWIEGYYPIDISALQEAARESLHRTVAEVVESRSTEVPVEDKVVEGYALRSLEEASDTASLVVIGSHHRSEVGAFLAGSVTNHLPTLAHCPVAVIPVAALEA